MLSLLQPINNWCELGNITFTPETNNPSRFRRDELHPGMAYLGNFY
jgi:hypothetical protein